LTRRGHERPCGAPAERSRRRERQRAHRRMGGLGERRQSDREEV